MGLMPRELPKGVSKDIDRHGNWRFYFRAVGRNKVRLHETPGTDEFEKEVACARLGIPYLKPGVEPDTRDPTAPAAEGTFRWLVNEYKARVKLDPTNKARRVRLLEEIAKSATPKGKIRGDSRIAGMERKHVLEIRDEIRSTPGAQNDVVKAISAIFGWAIENEVGGVKTNPALKIKKLNSGDGFHTWTVDEVAAYEAVHAVGSKARLALHLGLFTGLRLSDLAVVGRQHVKDGWLKIRPKKTAKKTAVVVELPIVAPLQKTLDESKDLGSLTFLVTEFGKPFSKNGLGNKMREWCDKAHLPQCTMHGLRKAGATIAAENGATDEELMAIFGWTTKSQTTVYTKKASRKRLAGKAAHKLIPEQTSTEIVPPAEGVEESGTKTAEKLSNING